MLHLPAWPLGRPALVSPLPPNLPIQLHGLRQPRLSPCLPGPSFLLLWSLPRAEVVSSWQPFSSIFPSDPHGPFHQPRLSPPGSHSTRYLLPTPIVPSASRGCPSLAAVLPGSSFQPPWSLPPAEVISPWQPFSPVPPSDLHGPFRQPRLPPPGNRSPWSFLPTAMVLSTSRGCLPLAAVLPGLSFRSHSPFRRPRLSPPGSLFPRSLFRPQWPLPQANVVSPWQSPSPGPRDKHAAHTQRFTQYLRAFVHGVTHAFMFRWGISALSLTCFLRWLAYPSRSVTRPPGRIALRSYTHDRLALSRHGHTHTKPPGFVMTRSHPHSHQASMHGHAAA